MTCTPPRCGVYAAKTFRHGASVVAAPGSRTPGRNARKEGCCAKRVSRLGLGLAYSRRRDTNFAPRVAEEHASLDSRCPRLRRVACCRQLRIRGADFAVIRDR